MPPRILMLHKPRAIVVTRRDERCRDPGRARIEPGSDPLARFSFPVTQHRVPEEALGRPLCPGEEGRHGPPGRLGEALLARGVVRREPAQEHTGRAGVEVEGCGPVLGKFGPEQASAFFLGPGQEP